MTINREIMKYSNKYLYHVVLVGSFAIAVYFIPSLQNVAAQYLDQIWLQKVASYVAAYLLAIYAIPEIVFFGYKAYLSNKRNSRE